jgi:hypothetical protein
MFWLIMCRAQGGDFTKGDGTGGKSIYGNKVRSTLTMKREFFSLLLRHLTEFSSRTRTSS